MRNFLDLVIDPADPKPVIADFQPWQGHAGTAVIIAGNNFSDLREENYVTIGGHLALVVEAATNRLMVISSPQAETGPVQVTVSGEIATGPFFLLVSVLKDVKCHSDQKIIRTRKYS